MPKTIEKTVLTFDELDDRAKDRAREWFREGNLDYDWWEFVYENAATCGAILGIEIDKRYGKGMDGVMRAYGPDIQFSGFWSQGDGASFDGRYEYVKGAAKKIRQHAPVDSELHRIADELQTLQRGNFYRLTARMKVTGRYSHSGSMDVDVSKSETGNDVASSIEQDLTQLMRDFADWIYRQLETEYEYQQSNEVIDESIRANEYQFRENGELDR